MDISRLHQILSETTVQLRKGEVFHQSGGLLTIDAMPHVNEAHDLVLVDMTLLTIGVDATTATRYKDELIELLKDYPEPDRLAAGPSYIEIGGTIGDQGAAFQLFALGKVLCLWDVITPERLGAEGESAKQMAGLGYVMITGFTGR